LQHGAEGWAIGWRRDIKHSVCASLDLIDDEAGYITYIDRLNRSSPGK
jgi:hypothetical protein